MKLNGITKILIIVFVIGLGLFAYPSFSNYWNLKHATQAVNEYSQCLNNVQEAEYQTIWENALEYNRLLGQRTNTFILTGELKAQYTKQLRLSDNGLMGYIEIPSINVSLPLYHGTTDSVLQRGIGHIEWSSLPVGGVGSHCVVSGHRGLPSAKLFTDLNKLREGDVFTVIVLNETMTYEVDQIRTVTPDDLSELTLQEDKDLCTLITCTPYGINTHRLLVRGHRVESAAVGASVITEAVLVDQVVVSCYIAIPLIIILFLIVMLKKPKKKTAFTAIYPEELFNET